ncbi:MAG: hypothetical protein U9Q33_05840 [Campylobacterota bacterium]|nr:hypothetical protein [Campylobacterota bacterium]
MSSIVISYKDWFDEHAQKHKKIIDKLSSFSDDEIIDYFDFDNMKQKEKDFCIMYKKNQKCHDMKELNCYLCACPNFRVGEFKSFCAIDSKDGSTIESKGYIHQNCSNCTIPHTKDYVKRYFNRDWKKIFCKTFILD